MQFCLRYFSYNTCLHNPQDTHKWRQHPLVKIHHRHQHSINMRGNSSSLLSICCLVAMSPDCGLIIKHYISTNIGDQGSIIINFEIFIQILLNMVNLFKTLRSLTLVLTLLLYIFDLWYCITDMFLFYFSNVMKTVRRPQSAQILHGTVLLLRYFLSVVFSSLAVITWSTVMAASQVRMSRI